MKPLQLGTFGVKSACFFQESFLRTVWQEALARDRWDFWALDGQPDRHGHYLWCDGIVWIWKGNLRSQGSSSCPQPSHIHFEAHCSLTAFQPARFVFLKQYALFSSCVFEVMWRMSSTASRGALQMISCWFPSTKRSCRFANFFGSWPLTTVCLKSRSPTMWSPNAWLRPDTNLENDRLSRVLVLLLVTFGLCLNTAFHFTQYSIPRQCIFTCHHHDWCKEK